MCINTFCSQHPIIPDDSQGIVDYLEKKIANYRTVGSDRPYYCAFHLWVSYDELACRHILFIDSNSYRLGYNAISSELMLDALFVHVLNVNGDKYFRFHNAMEHIHNIRM